MRSFLLYMFVLLSAICQAQDNNDFHEVYSNVDSKKPKIGQYIRFYEFWRCDGPGLIVSSELLIDSIAKAIKSYPAIVWEIGKHSDCRASAEYNSELMTQRARELYKYFLELGIDSSQITFKGYGESQLLNDCNCNRKSGDLGIDCTEEQHQQNRRTELKIIAVKE